MAYKLVFNPISGEFDFVDSGGAAVPNYFQAFNSTTDWSGPASGEYSITITAATHAKGINPQVVVFEEVSPGVFEQVVMNRVIMSSTGDITITVIDTPDLRFSGKIIIA